MFLSKGMIDQFGPLHKFVYSDKQYFLTDAKVLNPVTNNTDSHLLLCDGSFTPISLLPIELPNHLGKMANFSSPSFQRINNTMAIVSFRHNEYDASLEQDTYSFFVYFIDLVGKTHTEAPVV